jgi:hypothetical protein
VTASHDKNVTIRLARCGNGIDGVVRKIQHDLLQLNPITMQIVEIDANSLANASAWAKVIASSSVSRVLIVLT